jgi:hypothetical protein
MSHRVGASLGVSEPPGWRWRSIGAGSMSGDRWGYVGDPLDEDQLVSTRAMPMFGFDFTCEMDTTKKKPRAVITGEITYHDSPSSITQEGDLEPTVFPEIRLHGTVEPLSCQTCCRARRRLRACRRPCSKAPTGLRTGRSGLCAGSSSSRCSTRVSRAAYKEITGASFSIELIGGAYNGYTRGGYIEGGNVQVES